MKPEVFLRCHTMGKPIVFTLVAPDPHRPAAAGSVASRVCPCSIPLSPLLNGFTLFHPFPHILREVVCAGLQSGQHLRKVPLQPLRPSQTLRQHLQALFELARPFEEPGGVFRRRETQVEFDGEAIGLRPRKGIRQFQARRSGLHLVEVGEQEASPLQQGRGFSRFVEIPLDRFPGACRLTQFPGQGLTGAPETNLPNLDLLPVRAPFRKG